MANTLDQLVRITIVALVVLSCGVSLADEPQTAKADSEGFVRLHRTKDGQPVALETSIVSYRPKGDTETRLQVDLIGAIHVGDKAYYDNLNKAFRKYDVVLYELVARKDDVPQPGRRSAHPISAMQVGMKNMLELEFQLDHIKYGKKNMVHADLTPTEFSQSMQDRGESMTQMFLRMMGQSIAEQSKDPSGSGDFRMLFALLSKNRTMMLKRIMAEQLSDLRASTAVLDGPDGSTILTERNKRVMTVLKESIEEGHTTIGIFYGAAHMPDMEERLLEEFKLVRTKHRWVTAWSLTSKPAGRKPAERKPAERKPAERKPAERKPAERKPADSELADPVPAGSP
jgi:hypothetical protein